MRRLLALSILFPALPALAQFHAQWFFSEQPFNAPAAKTVWITKLWTVTSSGTNIYPGNQRYKTNTDAASVLTISNLIAGAYRIEYNGPFSVVAFTNVFGTNVSGLINAGEAQYISATIPVNGNTTAYSQAAADARFVRPADSRQISFTHPSNTFVGDGSDVLIRPFSFVEFGDIHGAYASSVCSDSNYSRGLFTNNVSAIIAMKERENIKMVNLLGDLVDFGIALGPQYVLVTNQLWRFRAAGISVCANTGNHEGSGPEWDRYMGPLLSSDPAYYGSEVPGTYTNIIMLQTNSGVPFVFVTVDFIKLAADATSWISNACYMFSNHVGIAQTHVWLNSHGGLTGGLVFESLSQIDNLRQVHSGHYRDAFNWAHRVDAMANGRELVSTFFNTQQNTNAGANYFRLYKYFPREGNVVAKTYDSLAGRWLKDGEAEYPGSVVTNGFWANFSFPIFGVSPSQQFLRLGGIKKTLQSYSSGPGNWNSRYSTNTLPDSGIVLSTVTDSGAWNDHWVELRYRGNSNLVFGFSSVSDSLGVATRVYTLRTNGFISGIKTTNYVNITKLTKVGSGALFETTDHTAVFFHTPGLRDVADGNTNYADFFFRVPPNMNTNHGARLHYALIKSSTAGDSVNRFQLTTAANNIYGANPTFNGSPILTTNTLPSGAGNRVATLSVDVSAWVTSGDLAPGLLKVVRISRQGDNVSDTLTGPVYVPQEMMLEYVSSQ